MFVHLVTVAFVGILFFDYLAIYRNSPRSWTIMAFVFTVGIVTAYHPGLVQAVSDYLGIWRAVDLLLYLSTIILIREFFISRIRQKEMSENITQLTRSLAIKNAEKL